MARYRLILQSTPSAGREPVRGLRALLKAALRQYGLRCVEVEEIPPEGQIPSEIDARGLGIGLPILPNREDCS